MAAGITYTPIATYTVSGSTINSVNFSSISGYTDIVGIVNTIVSSSTNAIRAIVNNDGAASYSRTVYYGVNGNASALSTRNSGMVDMTGQYGIGTGSNSVTFKFNYPSYASTTVQKSILWQAADNVAGSVAVGSSLYPTTTALTQINYNNKSG